MIFDMKKRGFFVLLFFMSGFFALFAQEIITAERYMEMVAERYGGIRDYEAKITIRSGNTDMYGTVSHLIPSFLRIDFTTPSEQVIVFDGELLTVYRIPGHSEPEHHFRQAEQQRHRGIFGDRPGAYPAQAELSARLHHRPRAGAIGIRFGGDGGQAQAYPAEHFRRFSGDHPEYRPRNPSYPAH